MCDAKIHSGFFWRFHDTTCNVLMVHRNHSNEHTLTRAKANNTAKKREEGVSNTERSHGMDRAAEEGRWERYETRTGEEKESDLPGQFLVSSKSNTRDKRGT